MNSLWFFLIAALLLAGLLYLISGYFSLWFTAYVTGTRIRLLPLMVMSLRKINPKLVVKCKIMAVQAGLADIPTNSIEAQILAGGNVERITLALIAAHRAGIDLDWDTAAAIDLAGRDILEAVRLSVNPKVISCPGRGGTLDAVAKDGIQLKVRVEVTVRTNLLGLVGGATEPTIIARVGEGIVSAIGSCESYREALSNPRLITRQVANAGLDSQTSFAIVSIDIADIDVGTNIGAKLQIDQANADIRIARAHAETRRSMALAMEQEMIALTREHEAAIFLAEAEIPLAEAQAFRRGQLRASRHPSHQLKVLPRPSPSSNASTGKTVKPPGKKGTRALESWESDGGACA